MAIRVFFEYKNRIVQMPVNPETLEVEHQGNNKTTEIVNLGNVNILKERKLAKIVLASFLPQYPDGGYVVTKGKFEGPEFYQEFFAQIVADKQPVRLIVSDTELNMLVSIEGVKYGREAGDNDIAYQLNLKEYRVNRARKLTIKEETSNDTIIVTAKNETREKVGFAIGDTVLVNGNYWYSSTGAEPHGTFSNYTGRISHITNPTRTYRYHITDSNGGYKGWVSESQLSHVER